MFEVKIDNFGPYICPDNHNAKYYFYLTNYTTYSAAMNKCINETMKVWRNGKNIKRKK